MICWLLCCCVCWCCFWKIIIWSRVCSWCCCCCFVFVIIEWFNEFDFDLIWKEWMHLFGRKSLFRFGRGCWVFNRCEFEFILLLWIEFLGFVRLGFLVDEILEELSHAFLEVLHEFLLDWTEIFNWIFWTFPAGTTTSICLNVTFLIHLGILITIFLLYLLLLFFLLFFFLNHTRWNSFPFSWFYLRLLLFWEVLLSFWLLFPRWLFSVVIEMFYCGWCFYLIWIID